MLSIGGKWPDRLELFIYPLNLLECWVSPSPVGYLVICLNKWLIRGKSTTYCTTVTFPRNASTSMSNDNGLNSQEKGHLDPATRVESEEIEDVKTLKSEFGDEKIEG